MVLQKLGFTFNEPIRTGPGMERAILSVYTGDNISEAEAKRLWAKIADHKWYVSERLSRDVGFHVAAVDFIENFYERHVEMDVDDRFAKFLVTFAAGARSAVA